MSAGSLADESIKTMQLYSHIDRIWNELGESGISKDTKDIIEVATMNKFDCYNYGGAKGAIESCVPLGLSRSSVVLDIGSGLGGPARCVADHSGCTLKGIELQSDLTALANQLTSCCGLADRVNFVAGDFLDTSIALGDIGSYDAVMSWLVVLHIPLSQRRAVYQRAYDFLKPGGKMYVEDFFLLSGDGFTEREQQLLREEVYVPDSDLPTRANYKDTLRSVGFDVEFDDVTATWTEFTAGRCEAWQQGKDRHERVHNKETWVSLRRFYVAIVELFQGGHLGGVRLVLTKPL